MDPRGAVSLVNPQKTGHKLPDDKCHGLTLPTYSRTLLVGVCQVVKRPSLTASLAIVIAGCHLIRYFSCRPIMPKQVRESGVLST